MAEKSFVSMEQNICIVCGHPFDTGALLLDKKMRERLEQHTITGMGLCPEHKKLFDDGYVALVECDPAKTVITNNIVKPQDAYRTGNMAHVRRAIATQIFNTDVGDVPVMFIEPGVIEKLQAMMPPEDKA